MYQVIFNTHDVVLLMTIYQCTLYAILVLALSYSKTISKSVFLALFLLSQAAIPLDILISFGAEFRKVALAWSPSLFYTFGFAYWIEGVLLLWYTKSVLYKNFWPRPKEYLYLLPVLAYLIYEILFYYSLSLADQKALQEGYELASAPGYMNYVTLFRELLRLFFSVLCIVEIQRYRKSIRHNFSDVKKMDLQWLNFLVYSFCIIRAWAVLVSVMIMGAIYMQWQAPFEIMGLIGNYTTFLLVSLLIFFSLKYSQIISHVKVEEPKAQNAVRNTDMDATLNADAIQRFEQYIHQERPYLQRSLTMEQLSEGVGIEPKTLSAIIHHEFDKNFFEFINEYRIQEAKKLLEPSSSAELSILDVMYESGFNSKATFNTLFKKATHMTPSQYRKHLSHSNNPSIA